MRIRRLAAAASVTVLAFSALTACGGSDEKDNSKTDAKALADQATEAMKAKNSVKVVGTGTDEDGKSMSMDACADIKTKAVKGTMTMDGRKVEILQTDGSMYMKADAVFWAAQSGNENNPAALDAVTKAGGDKWIKNEADKDDDFADFFDGKTDGLAKGEVTTFNGKKAIPLSRSEDGTKKTYFIAAKGTPLILGSVEEKEDGSKEREESKFSTSSDKCDPKAPAESVDIEVFSKKIDEAMGSDG
ncbi:hypothetical protein GCM10023205_08000 [Yinghuangia aomiensis]|uniref:Lipoprotein n=1 Tax=Yinghuangia aomiensis TaxID=676205 RepID=A0ABP9GTL3_9ACTN